MEMVVVSSAEIVSGMVLIALPTGPGWRSVGVGFAFGPLLFNILLVVTTRL